MSITVKVNLNGGYIGSHLVFVQAINFTDVYKNEFHIFFRIIYNLSLP